MSKLSTLKVGVVVMPNALSPIHRTQKERDAFRYKNKPLRKLYYTPRWKKLREEVLERDGYTCQLKGCGILLIHKLELLVANHRIPHNGDLKLFWDKNNLECICKPCHDSIVQSREIAMRNQGK